MGDKLVVAGPQGARFVVKHSRWNGSPKGPKTPGPTGGKEQKAAHSDSQTQQAGMFLEEAISSAHVCQGQCLCVNVFCPCYAGLGRPGPPRRET